MCGNVDVDAQRVRVDRLMPKTLRPAFERVMGFAARGVAVQLIPGGIRDMLRPSWLDGCPHRGEWDVELESKFGDRANRGSRGRCHRNRARGARAGAGRGGATD
jgi:hypothetical protein